MPIDLPTALYQNLSISVVGTFHQEPSLPFCSLLIFTFTHYLEYAFGRCV